MTGGPKASRRVICAALAGAAALSATLFPGAAALAGPADKLRDSLSRGRSAEISAPPIARFVAQDGRVFVLDRTQPAPMLKFEDSPEVWVLSPSPAPRGDVIYKNDLGEPMLRATRLGGVTLFSRQRPAGEPVSLAGGGVPLRLGGLSPQALSERMLQASVRSGRAARRQVVFEAEATPASAALIADAAMVVSLAFVRLAGRDRDALGQVDSVRFSEGRRPSASLADGVLTIVVSPGHGLAGRPSSDRVAKAIRTAD
ncbi:DUF4908 domain-containing protein [Phenylobacterium sp. SCN 70-31]|uniref:DUF4908 domain-containing protein n=1 Tax=Phenylobacterium sp. SCN 70-31 TaxID=1660129 RepID=UPI00086BE541|nr:DUF4908 domain-containing protein [Phenylobacterium sp. SCN 70-31]ODT87621.1 MAG: DUF4908 domain-containing protein [Phenylobacterium sp. SCN 70-31]